MNQTIYSQKTINNVFICVLVWTQTELINTALQYSLNNELADLQGLIDPTGTFTHTDLNLLAILDDPFVEKTLKYVGVLDKALEDYAMFSGTKLEQPDFESAAPLGHHYSKYLQKRPTDVPIDKEFIAMELHVTSCMLFSMAQLMETKQVNEQLESGTEFCEFKEVLSGEIPDKFRLWSPGGNFIYYLLQQLKNI